MHENLLKKFMHQLFQYITDESPNTRCNLIKQNKDRLDTTGDFSFPNKRNVWMSYMSSARQEAGFCSDVSCKHNSNNELFVNDDADADTPKTEVNPFQHTHYTITTFLAVSNSFALPVARVKIVGDWCNVYLDRRKCFEKILAQVLENVSVGQGCERLTRKPIRITSDDGIGHENHLQSVTDYRLKLLESVIKNLINESDYLELCENETETNEKPIHVHLTTKSNIVVACDKKIVSGIVIDPQNGKLATVTADEYIKPVKKLNLIKKTDITRKLRDKWDTIAIKKRSTDMQLMAQHKYGLRVKNDAVFVALIKQLGLAAVTVDFMEVRHSSPVALNRSGCSTSKGASFILYNSARIETIIRKFNEKVECGYYKALPDLSDIDISLLSEEEEWQIVIVYVAGYENLIEKSLADIENGKISPHLLCNYLCGLVGLFSIYYRRCRILTENRSQLMPQLYARIYLLKCIQRTLNNALALLNIDPVTQM